MTARYCINLFWSEPDGAWVADVPDLQYCSALGDSPAEALAKVEKAMEAWLAVAREDRPPIPEPRHHGTKRAPRVEQDCILDCRESGIGKRLNGAKALECRAFASPMAPSQRSPRCGWSWG